MIRRARYITLDLECKKRWYLIWYRGFKWFLRRDGKSLIRDLGPI